MEDTIIKKWLSQVRKGTLELCVLGLIRGRTLYALALIQELETFEGFTVSEGAIYPLLKRLQNEGWVSTFWQESDAGPPRKYYQLTPAGETLLMQMEAAWQQFSQTLNTILERNSAHDSRTASAHPPLPLAVTAKPESTP